MKSVQLNKEINMKTSSPQFTITKEYAEEFIEERIGQPYQVDQQDWEDLVVDITSCIRELMDDFVQSSVYVPENS